MITLFCFLDGSSLDQPFSVDIDESRPIHHLKVEVKRKLSPALDNVVAAELSLYRVSVPGEDGEELRRIIKRIDPSKDKLCVLKKVGNLFPSPAEKHIHVIVKTPSKFPS